MTRPGRLLIVSDYAGARGAGEGGAGVVVRRSFEALRDLGAAVDLLAGFHLDDDLQGPHARSLGGRDLREAGAAGRLAAVYNPASRRALAAALEGYDPADTAVVLHQWTRWLSPSAMEPLSRHPLMVYGHDHFWACPNGAYYDFREEAPCTRAPGGAACRLARCDRQGYAHKLVRLARHDVKAWEARDGRPRRVLLSLSARADATLAAIAPRERRAVVHNPLDAPEPSAPSPPPDTDLGYFGRLEPEKGVMDLAEAALAHGWRALFVGDGSLADQLGALGLEVVRWAPRPEALAAMRRCRAVVLPSRWPETWGLVTAEAMAQGVPVIVSTRAGSAELVERFGSGRVFDPAEEGALAAAASALLASPPSAGERTRTAQAVVEALSPRAHAERLVGLARELFGLDVLSAGRR